MRWSRRRGATREMVGIGRVRRGIFQCRRIGSDKGKSWRQSDVRGRRDVVGAIWACPKIMARKIWSWRSILAESAFGDEMHALK